jgi:serine phosphatase RsbU (regulator of sigma subunit)/CheY-like chemotaxis protein
MAKETILVVEDETLVGLELKEDLERLGYFVPEVIETGEAVVQAVARFQPDLLLMDIRLRGSLDGIEAAYQTKAEFDIPIIYLTAYSDTDTLRRAALTGPDAFLLKPFDERELAVNVELALSRAKSGEPLRRELRGAISLVDALEEPALIADLEGRIAHANKAAVALLKVSDASLLARVELSRILEPTWNDPGRKFAKVLGGSAESSGMVASVERLLRSDGRTYGSLVVFGNMERRERLLLEASAAEANSMLIRLLPELSAAGPGYRIGGFLDPCLSGSGDFFDVFAAGDGVTAFYGLDVMGHGVIASLMAFTLHDVLPMMSRRADGKAAEPAEVLRSLYERYCRKGEKQPGSTFFTIAYGTVESATGNYRIARAGYTPVLHLEAGGRLHVYYTKGTAVGITSDSEIEEAQGSLQSGDRLLIASDGLLAAFGGGLLERSLEILSTFTDSLRGSSLEDFVEAFRRRSREMTKKGPQDDDVSLLVFERA